MKKALVTFFAFAFCLKSLAQKVEDNRIIVTVADTNKLYERTRQAIVNTDLIIRNDSKRDTLITLPERIAKMTVYVIAKIIIKENIIEISGAYGSGFEDFWGFPGWPKGYTQIIYYKESESWKILRRIAIKLDGKMSYSRVN